MIGIEDRDCGFPEKVDVNGQGEEERKNVEMGS